MIISFWPLVKLKHNFELPTGDFSNDLIKRLVKAKAVIVPPYIRPYHYWFCKRLGLSVFPCLDAQFQFPGKIGDFLVFKSLDLPCPDTKIFWGKEDLKNRLAAGEKLYEFPFVLKWNWGGGGAFVLLIKGMKELWQALERFQKYEPKGPQFVIQPYVPHEPYDLRVVIIGKRLIPYWRVQDCDSEFRNNVGRGAKVQAGLFPELESACLELTRKLALHMQIELAAVDIMFTKPERRPLFVEINYRFGIKGIGGYPAFKKMVNEEVKRWLKAISSG